jgi:hypothetical protein
VKGIAEAMLSRDANVIAVRYESTALTCFFLNDCLRAGRKVLKSDGRRSRIHSDKDAKEADDGGHSHYLVQADLRALPTSKPLIAAKARLLGERSMLAAWHVCNGVHEPIFNRAALT